MNKQVSRPQSILLVEDNEDDYEATCRAFKKANLHNPIVWCRSGRDALDRLKGEGAHRLASRGSRPGLVLLDLNMPGMDGRKTLDAIKRDTTLKQIPVIVLTTSADEHDVLACYQMGANTYVQKPISFEALIEAIRRLKEYWFEIALLPKDADHE
jgi:two-component system, response regulator